MFQPGTPKKSGAGNYRFSAFEISESTGIISGQIYEQGLLFIVRSSLIKKV